MNNPYISMKFGLLALLIMSALVATVVLSGCVPAPAGAHAAANSLQGVWIVTVSPPNNMPTETVVTTFHSDGSVTEMTSDARVGMGVWEKASGRGYVFTMWEYWKDGEASFQAKISSTIELTDGAETYSAPFTLQVFVVGNPNPVGGGIGTATGVRMHVK